MIELNDEVSSHGLIRQLSKGCRWQTQRSLRARQCQYDIDKIISFKSSLVWPLDSSEFRRLLTSIRQQ